MKLLYDVLRGCAETACCEDFVERNGKWYAVVTNADIRAYCEARRIGPFSGKASTLYAFVEADSGMTAHTVPRTAYWNRGTLDLATQVAAFLRQYV